MDINNVEVDKVFTYAVPEGMALCAGVRVRVPFGPRTLTGMVMGTSESTDVSRE